jgi:putative tryptophan/tyrosine transport system substrate-binding protein
MPVWCPDARSNLLSAKMLQRVTLLLCLIGLLGIDFAQAAPEPGRVYRLLLLDSQAGSPYEEVRIAMLDTLAEFGYRAGENLHLTQQSSGNDLARGIALLEAEQDSNPDVIYVGGTLATIAAREVFFGARLPVVFAGTTDPVGIGVIDDFDHPPKANFTGVCYPVPIKARLRFIHHLLPEARRFGLIYADMPQSRSYNAWLRRALEEEPLFGDFEILFRSVPLIKGEQGDQQMAALALPLLQELDAQVDAFIAPNDQLGSRSEFAKLFARHASKPLIGLVRNDVMEGWGAVAAVFPQNSSIGRSAAEMVRDLFEGRSLSEIQPQWPERFGYAVDLGRAQALGVRVPVGILQLAGGNIVR